MSKSRGFTFVELLITITIIAILSAIALMTYTYVMKQGRDSKRMADLRAIQSALEQYYSDQGFYPFTNSTSPPIGLSELAVGNPFTNSIGNPVSPASPKTYIKSFPGDPTGVVSYQYVALPYYSGSMCKNSSADKCTSYCLYAQLENTSSGLGNCPVAGTYNFAVSPP